MANLKGYYYLYVVFILAIAMNHTAMAREPSSRAVKGAYWPSYAGFPASAIDTSLFTHLYYAFLVPNNVSLWFDISNSTALTLWNFTSTVSGKSPPAKTLVAIGGAGADPDTFSQMASKKSWRESFIDSSIEVARKYGFDGIDLDWEFPQNSTDMENLGYLLQEWRAAVQKEANATCRSPLLLTAAVYFSVEFFLSAVVRTYPVDSINQNLDWVNAMTYDYHGSWDTNVTGTLAGLFDPLSNLSTSYGLRSWIDAGLHPTKLIMGLPLYGRTWRLKDPSVNGIGAPAVGVGPGTEGVLTFSQVEAFNKANNATVVYDVDTVSTYSYSGTSWITYDDVRSITAKIVYVKALEVRGYFFWAVNDDLDWKIPRLGEKIYMHFIKNI